MSELKRVMIDWLASNSETIVTLYRGDHNITRNCTSKITFLNSDYTIITDKSSKGLKTLPKRHCIHQNFRTIELSEVEECVYRIIISIFMSVLIVRMFLKAVKREENIEHWVYKIYHTQFKLSVSGDSTPFLEK